MTAISGAPRRNPPTIRSVRASAAWGAFALLGAIAAASWVAQPRSTAGAHGREPLAHRIDPNTASRDELMLLPGIGPKLAEAIVSHRESAARRPAFRTAQDLEAVPRIGPKTIERLRPYLCFDSDSEPRRGSIDPSPTPAQLAEDRPRDGRGRAPGSAE